MNWVLEKYFRDVFNSPEIYFLSSRSNCFWFIVFLRKGLLLSIFCILDSFHFLPFLLIHDPFMFNMLSISYMFIHLYLSSIFLCPFLSLPKFLSPLKCPLSFLVCFLFHSHNSFINIEYGIRNESNFQVQSSMLSYHSLWPSCNIVWTIVFLLLSRSIFFCYSRYSFLFGPPWSIPLRDETYKRDERSGKMLTVWQKGSLSISVSHPFHFVGSLSIHRRENKKKRIPIFSEDSNGVTLEND